MDSHISVEQKVKYVPLAVLREHILQDKRLELSYYQEKLAQLFLNDQKRSNLAVRIERKRQEAQQERLKQWEVLGNTMTSGENCCGQRVASATSQGYWMCLDCFSNIKKTRKRLQRPKF